MTTRRLSRAFTLLEVLIALTIVVILVGVMSSTIMIAFREKNAAERAIEAVRDIQAAGDLVVDELRNAMPPTATTLPSSEGGIVTDTSELGLGQFTGGNLGTAGGLGSVSGSDGWALYGQFQGNSQSISFYSTGAEPRAPLQHDAKWVQYGLGEAPDRSPALVRMVDTNLLSYEAIQNPSQETLIKNVRNVAFTYWDGTQWLDSWDSAVNYDTLPYAVKFVLTLDPLEEGGPERVITRVASIGCAAPPATMDSSSGIINTGVTPGLNTGF